MLQREGASRTTLNSNLTLFAVGFLAATVALSCFLLYVVPPRAFVVFYFATTPILKWAERPRRSEWAAWTVSGTVAWVAYALIHGARMHDWIGGGVIGFAIAAMFVTALAITSSPPGAQRDAALRFSVIGAMPLLLLIGMVGLTFGGTGGATFDATLAAVDHTLWVDPSFSVGRVLHSSAALNSAAQVGYDALPLAVAAVGAAVWRRRGEADARTIFLALALSGLVAWVCFAFLPAAGPVYKWGSRFPLSPPAPADLIVGKGALAIEGFRNALPSMHMVAALLVVFATSSLSTAWRLLACITCVITVVATLGTGQHYFIDLAAAVPLAAAAYAGARHGWMSRRVVGLNLLALGILVTAVRLFGSVLVSHPKTMWTAIGVTASWSLGSVLRLGGLPPTRLAVVPGTRLPGTV